MDILFEKLLETIERFIQLAEKAPYNLTEKAIKNNKPTPPQLEGWKEMLAKAKDRYDKLKILLNDDFGKNKGELDRYMEFYRQLPRYLAEIPCIWSTHYEDVTLTVRKITMILYDIDTKYKLGDEQYRKYIKK